MDKLKELLSKCKCGVYIYVNQHRDYYQSAEEMLSEMADHGCPPVIESEVRKIMIDTNTLVQVQFYPDTPIGSYSIYHHDIELALQQALDCFT